MYLSSTSNIKYKVTLDFHANLDGWAALQA
jgi:hypothetical protein